MLSGYPRLHSHSSIIQHSALSIQHFMIDSHCHLADEAFTADLDEVVSRARRAGVGSALCVLAAGNDGEMAAAGRVSERWPSIRFSVGVHPHTAAQFAARVEDALETVRHDLEALAACAVGEIGLDYHYDFSPRDVQRDLFEAQLGLARELSLPVVIHTREATADTLAVLRAAGRGAVRGVFHCFSGDAAMARDVLDLGFYISMSGIVTFPRAVELRDVARLVPADRLLVETDAPYLAPVPHRGRRNEPAYVTRVGEELARVRSVPVDELATLMSRNFQALFGPTVSS
jgi:TatD DNase family protein